MTLSARDIRAFTSGLKSANISSMIFFRLGSSALGWATHSGKVATTFMTLFLLYTDQLNPLRRFLHGSILPTDRDM